MTLRKKTAVVAMSVAALLGIGGAALAGPMLPNSVSGGTVEISDIAQPDDFTAGTSATYMYGFGSTGTTLIAGESDFRFEWCADVDKLETGNAEAVFTVELVINGVTTNTYPPLAFNSEDEARAIVCQSAVVPKSEQGSGSSFTAKFAAKSTHSNAYYVRNYHSH